MSVSWRLIAGRRCLSLQEVAAHSVFVEADFVADPGVLAREMAGKVAHPLLLIVLLLLLLLLLRLRLRLLLRLLRLLRLLLIMLLLLLTRQMAA